jgi:hypothetical protein
MESPPQTFVVSAGSVFDGITLYGPFEYFTDAVEWAEQNLHIEWAVIEVEAP